MTFWNQLKLISRNISMAEIQCGNLAIFLPLWFYVKLILTDFRRSKIGIWTTLEAWNFDFWGISHLKMSKIPKSSKSGWKFLQLLYCDREINFAYLPNCPKHWFLLNFREIVEAVRAPLALLLRHKTFHVTFTLFACMFLFR